MHGGFLSCRASSTERGVGGCCQYRAAGHAQSKRASLLLTKAGDFEVGMEERAGCPVRLIWSVSLLVCG